LWVRVQAKKQRRKDAHSHSHKEGGYLLKGVLYCGNCGKPLYGNPNRNGKKSGMVIYVCKTAVKYGPQCSCGQWSVREEDILPFIVGRLLEEIDRKVLFEASTRPPRHRKPRKDVTGLERKLTDLARKIDLGTERFLTASLDLVPDLSRKLSEWKEARESAQAEIEKTRQECDPSWEQTLKKRHAWLESMKAKLLHIETVKRSGKHGYSTGVYFTTDSFREFLISHGCRVDIWWSKKSACRWQIAKIRIRLHETMDDMGGEEFDWAAANHRRNGSRTRGHAAHFVTHSSLIV
jgi:Recombinase zinc beta ribbon domain